MRAIRKIQASFRAWKIRQRINCLVSICSYIASIDSCEVFMEESVYTNLSTFQDLIHKVLLPEQRFDFELLGSDYRARVNWPGRGLPKWFCDRAGIKVFNMIVSKIKKISETKTGSLVEKSCFTLMHTVSEEDLPRVVSSSDYFDSSPDLKFVKVKF